MQFSLSYLRSILPPVDPPEDLVPQEIRAAIGLNLFAAGQDEPDLINRSARWTYAMFRELDEGEAQPFLKTAAPLTTLDWKQLHPAVGALDPDFEIEAFGLVIHLPIAQSAMIGEVRFPRLDRSFPVAVRVVVEDLHALPTLTNASSACWAEDNTQAGFWGFLTCRHALSHVSSGATVPLNGGGNGNVRRKAPTTVDAAFVGTNNPSMAMNRLQVATSATAGQSVDVATGAGLVARSVVEITNTLGVIDDPYHPIKVYIDQPCQPGDSGSLVSLRSNAGIGIYCGSLSGATVGGHAGQTVGFAQHLEQAISVLDVTPHI
jgi:hypothetical protein